MYVHIYDLETLTPAAVLTNFGQASCGLAHNESSLSELTVLAGTPEIGPLVLDLSGKFDLRHMLDAPKLWTAQVRDDYGNLRMQGKISILPAGTEGFYEIIVYDLLDELRLIPLPPQRYLNGFVLDLISEILSYMPPANRRREMAVPTVQFVVGERWHMDNVTETINAWTTIDASRMSCLEAIISVCESTGNNFRLNPDGSRSIDVYADPKRPSKPAANITLGGFYPKEPAERNLTLIDQPVLTIENDTIIAGVLPEGGSYQNTENIERILRLDGTETVPDGYRLENVYGTWGVFNEDLVADPVMSAMPTGQIRSEVFGNIVPLINTDESISAVVTEIAGNILVSPAFGGYAPDHWKDATVDFAEEERRVVSSSGTTIAIDEEFTSLTVNDTVGVSVFREWDDNKITDSQQSLAGAVAAYLESNAKLLVSWQVRVPSNDLNLQIGQYVRLIYSGGIQMRNAQSNIVRHLPSVAVSQVFVIARLSVTQASGIEYLDLTLTERLWRFPSSSGLREIMALIQRRMPGVRMGREGAAYSEQFVITTVASGACSLGFRGVYDFNPVFASAPRVISSEPALAGTVVETTATTTSLVVCANRATTVRVTIVPSERR